MQAIIFAVGDVVWNALTAGVVTLVLAWMTNRASIKAAAAAAQATAAATQANASANKAAVKTEAVKVALEKSTEVTTNKLDSMAKVGEMTHTLVNSNMGIQLKLTATVTRQLADLTKNPAHLEAALLAEKLYAEHVKNQEKADANAAAMNANTAATEANTVATEARTKADSGAKAGSEANTAVTTDKI